MENQNTDKIKSNLGISLLTGCGTSVAAFVVSLVLCYALVMLLLPGESGYFIQMILGPGCGILLALIMAIVGGVAVYRASQPKPLVFGILIWAGISLLVSLTVYGLGTLLNNSFPALLATTTDMSTAFTVLMAAEVIIILAANVLALVVGGLVYRRQKSKLNRI